MADRLHVAGPIVAVAGDWHGEVSWVQRVIPAIHRADDYVTDILHVGDFGLWPGGDGARYLDSVDYWCQRSGIQRILVTPGNHDDWDQLDIGHAANPGQPLQVSDHVFFLPRAYRFTIGRHTAMSFGGAASTDKDWRLTARLKHPVWWEHELATEAEVEAAIGGGPVDVLISHDAANTALEPVQRARSARTPNDEVRDYAAISIDQVTRIRDHVTPEMHLHGHYHVKGNANISLPNGEVVNTVALSQEWSVGNVAMLDTLSMTVRFLDATTQRIRFLG